jgi:hypothetical protein
MSEIGYLSLIVHNYVHLLQNGCRPGGLEYMGTWGRLPTKRDIVTTSSLSSMARLRAVALGSARHFPEHLPRFVGAKLAHVRLDAVSLPENDLSVDN